MDKPVVKDEVYTAVCTDTDANPKAVVLGEMSEPHEP